MIDCIIWLMQDQGRDESSTCLQAIGSNLESQSLWICQPDQKLSTILEPLGKGIHNFLVASQDTDQGLSILSQTDVLKFISKSIKSDAVILDALSCQLGSILDLPNPHMITASPHDSVADTLVKMNENGIRSVAVCNEKGLLVDYFSMSDLKTYFWAASHMSLTKDSVNLLKKMSIEQFLTSLRGGVSMKPGKMCKP